MPIRSASDALVHLQATMQDKSPALIREALTNPKSEFLEWVQQESKELRDIVEKTLDHVLTEQSPRVRFQDFYNLFLAMEEMGNALTDTRDFGTALSKHILTAQGVDKDTMEQFLDVVNLDKRQQFESSVVRAIPSQLSQHDDASGLRHFVSGLSVAQLSPSTKESMDILVDALNQVETSTRYEILARVDAYIRSGWARNDLESDDPSGASLREAFARLKEVGDTTKDNPAVAPTILALFSRFDHLFHKVVVQNGKAIDYGNFANQPGYKSPSFKTSPDCLKRAGKGLVDVAILCHNKPNEWITTLVTSAKSPDWIGREGEQHARHIAALKADWYYVDPKRNPKEAPRPLPPQTVRPGIAYGAIINTNSRSKLLQQLKLSPLSPTVQSINDLPLLFMLSNRKDYTESETLDITCMGALPNMDLVGSLDTDEYPRKVAEQVITAVSGLLQASVDTLVAASDLANSIGLATNVMALHQDNEHLIQNAPVKEWRQTVNALNLKLTSGDFAPIRQLNMAITALQCLQMEAAASPAMG